MKKYFVWACVLMVTLPALAAEKTIELPAPDVLGGMPLMEAIAARKSTREFSAKKIENTDLSNILYAAWGLSHEGKRTIPTAMNKQDLEVYAAMDNGIWRYNASEHELELVSEENIKPLIDLQDYVKEAPLTLIFVGKNVKDASMNAAAAYQNVGLYCASRGLDNVVRGYVNREKIAEVLSIKSDEVIITQSIGWPYM